MCRKRSRLYLVPSAKKKLLTPGYENLGYEGFEGAESIPVLRLGPTVIDNLSVASPEGPAHVIVTH